MSLPMELNEKCGEYHAISDVYCEKRHWFLVEYPSPLIIGISAAGLLAFILTGFLGYNGRLDCGGHPTCWQLEVFSHPWPLYVWFSALMITLQVSILRNHQLRTRLVATLVATLVSTVLAYWLYFYGHLDQVVQEILHLHFGLISGLFTNRYFLTVLNFGLILLFVADSALRWSRRARGLKPSPDLEIDSPQAAGPDEPRVEEMAAGDFLAGLALFGLMALIFTYTFIHSAAAFPHFPPDPHHPIRLDVATVPNEVPLLGGIELSQIDRFLALICLPIGFLILGISALLNGMSAIGAVDDVTPRPVPAIQGASESITAQVGLVILNTLRSAADRYFRIILARAAYALRNFFWLVLIFFASLGLVVLAVEVQTYLHNHGAPGQLGTISAAVVATAVAVLSVVLSASLLLFSGRVAANSLRLLGWIGFVLSLTFWLFSAGMVGLDWIFQAAALVPPSLTTAPGTCVNPFLHNLWIVPLPGTHLSPACNQPFAVSYLTLASAGFLMIWLVFLLVRQFRATSRAAASESQAAMAIPPTAIPPTANVRSDTTNPPEG